MMSFNDKVRAKLSLYLINYALHHEEADGSGRIDPHFLISALVGDD
jgi:hypothetical protein